MRICKAKESNIARGVTKCKARKKKSICFCAISQSAGILLHAGDEMRGGTAGENTAVPDHVIGAVPEKTHGYSNQLRAWLEHIVRNQGAGLAVQNHLPKQRDGGRSDRYPGLLAVSLKAGFQ